MIITGHGSYASGIKSTVDLIAGSNHNIAYVDFLMEDTSDDLKNKLKLEIETQAEVGTVFVCDLIGGTPFKMAAELALETNHLEVIAGCNIGAVVEGLIKMPHMAPSELADYMQEATVRSVMKFTPMDFSTVISPSEEGI